MHNPYMSHVTTHTNHCTFTGDYRSTITIAGGILSLIMIPTIVFTVTCCMYQKKADTKVRFAKSSNDTGSFKITILHSTSSRNVVSNQDKNCYVTESNQRTTTNAASNTPTPGYSSHADNVSTSSTIQVMPKGNTTESNSKIDQNKMASDVIITDNPSYNVGKSNEGGITDSMYIYPSQPSEPPINKVIEEMSPKQQTVDSGRKECVNTLYSLGTRECNNALYEGLGASEVYAIPINPYGITVLTTSQDSYEYEYVGGQDSIQEVLHRSRAVSINTLTDRDNVMVSPNPSYGIASLARSMSGSSYNYTAPQYCEDSTDNVVLHRNPSYSVTPLKRSPSPNGYDYIAAKDYEVSTVQAVNVHRDECSNALYGTSECRKAPNGDDESNHYDMITSNNYDYVVHEHTVHGHREDCDSTNFRPRECHNALYAGDGAKPIPNETMTESQDSYDYI